MYKRPRRSFRDGHKRIVAARQSWKCNACNDMLSSSFQVDHTIPLFRGGEDSIANASALCEKCHAQKTQLEAIERNAEKRQQKLDEAQAAQREFEARVRREAYAGRTLTKRPNGQISCSACHNHFYALFGHAICPSIEDAINHALHPTKKVKDVKDDNPFVRFRYCDLHE